MTDTSMAPETPTVAETAHFLRRFADMMSVGQNANYLQHGAVWLETLSAHLTAARDEEQLWRYKYETIAQHVDVVEAECEALKHDIDGHVGTISTTLSERDALKATLQARDAELVKLRSELDLERNQVTATAEKHAQALAELRDSFDRERETFTAAAERHAAELDRLRLQLAEQAKAHELELSRLRLDFAGERHDFAARLKVSGDELAAFRAVAERERDTLMAKITGLEAKRAELRSAFERIGQLRNQTAESLDETGVSLAKMLEADAQSGSAQPATRNPAVGETDVMVPRATLRQARSQFEYLAHEFTDAGDVASQVMCELGAFTMELALGSGRKADPLPVGDVALSILASPGSAAPAVAGTR